MAQLRFPLSSPTAEVAEAEAFTIPSFPDLSEHLEREKKSNKEIEGIIQALRPQGKEDEEEEVEEKPIDSSKYQQIMRLLKNV